MLWGSRHSRCGASWTGNWVVGEHKQGTQAACRCFVDEGIVPLLRLYSGIKTKWTLFIPCALLSSSPYGWYPLYPSPTIQSVIFLFLFRFVKNKHCPFKCPASLPWEMLYLDLFLQTSQLHRKFQSGAKDGQEYKTLMAVPEQIGKKNRILTKCFIWKDLNLPPVFPGLADIMGSACLYEWFTEHLLAGFPLKKQQL